MSKQISDASLNTQVQKITLHVVSKKCIGPDNIIITELNGIVLSFTLTNCLVKMTHLTCFINQSPKNTA